MTIEDEGHFLDKLDKNKLFDLHLVCEMIVAGIILYTAEKQLDVDENDVADFIIKNFSQILDTITQS
jgi:hypothetical protein